MLTDTHCKNAHRKNWAHPSFTVCWYHGANGGRPKTHGKRTKANDAARAEITRIKRET